MRGHNEEPREMTDLVRVLREQVEAVGAEHPEAGEIVDYALDPDSLDPRRFSELAAHLETCPSCRDEVEKVRSGVRPTRIPALFRNPAGRPAWGRIAAAAALILALVIPAYQGLFTFDMISTTGEPLYLEGAYRADEINIPVLDLATGPASPEILLAHDPWSTPGAGEDPWIRIFLYAAEDRAPLWQQRVRAGDLKNPAGGDLHLNLPAELLEPGIYRLEILGGQPEILQFRDRFLVR